MIFIKKIIILLLCLILFPSNIFAFSNDYFDISITDEFKETKTDDELAFKWVSDSDNKLPSIVITIEKNNSATPYNIESYTVEELVVYKKQIVNKMKESLKDYDIDVTVSNIEKKNINGLTSMYYTIYWPTKDSYGYDMYQRSTVFTTKKYVTTIIYSTTDEKDYKTTKYIDLINSLKIKDTSITDYNFFDSTLNRIVIVGIIGGIIGFIISAVRKKRR